MNNTGIYASQIIGDTGTAEEEIGDRENNTFDDVSPTSFSALAAATSVAWGALVATLYLITMAVNLGLVHYERVVPDAYRTLVNRMVAVLSLYRMAIATFILPALAIRTCFQVWMP